MTVYLSQHEKKLISVLALFKQGYSILFNNEVLIKLNGSFLYSEKLIDGLYQITSNMYEIHDTELNKKLHNLPLKRNVSSNNPTYVWPLRLGHINLKRIDRLVRQKPLSSLTIQPLPACTSCLERKMTTRPFCKGQQI